AAAASLLADEFEVRAWRAGEAGDSGGLTPPPPTPPPGPPPPGGRRVRSPPARPAAGGPGPPRPGRPPRRPGRPPAPPPPPPPRARLERELSELNAIGIRLSSERNVDVLLEMILTKAREITRSDAGSLYLVEEAPEGGPRLRFALAQNRSVEIPFRAVTLPLDDASVAGYVALTGEIVNLVDAYVPPAGSRFQINRWF